MSISGSAAAFVSLTGNRLELSPGPSIATGTYNLVINTWLTATSTLILSDNFTIVVDEENESIEVNDQTTDVVP